VLAECAEDEGSTPAAAWMCACARHCRAGPPAWWKPEVWPLIGRNRSVTGQTCAQGVVVGQRSA